MDTIFLIYAILICSLNFVFLLYIFIYMKNFQKFQREINQDYADALGNVLKIIIKSSEDNFNSLSSIQDWNQKAFEKIIEIQNQNSQKIIEQIVREQMFLSRMAEQFGYRPRAEMEP